MQIVIPDMIVTTTVSEDWYRKATRNFAFSLYETEDTIEKLKAENHGVEYIAGKYNRGGLPHEHKAIFRDMSHFNEVKQQLLQQAEVAPFGEPCFAYRETITQAVTAKGIFAHQTSCPGHYAHIILTVAPVAQQNVLFFTVERDPALEKTLSEPLPQDGIEKEIQAMLIGIRREALCGGHQGYPVTGVEVRLRATGQHPVDTRISDFTVAAQIAFRNAIEEVAAYVIEPLRSDDSSSLER